MSITVWRLWSYNVLRRKKCSALVWSLTASDAITRIGVIRFYDSSHESPNCTTEAATNLFLRTISRPGPTDWLMRARICERDDLNSEVSPSSARFHIPRTQFRLVLSVAICDQREIQIIPRVHHFVCRKVCETSVDDFLSFSSTPGDFKDMRRV